jgi:hypothetical protein
MTWGKTPPPCPNCGGVVYVGIMSLKATCEGPDKESNYCGYWWDDVNHTWNHPLARLETADFTESESLWVAAFRKQVGGLV